MFILASRDMAASFPTIDLKTGLSDVTARKNRFATSDGCSEFYTIWFNASDMLFAIST
ncbi:MAG: hypothetical protein WCE91_11565 [Nitrososphaeraceae archaeon]